MSEKFFRNIRGQETMTYQGTMNKIGILLGIVLISAMASAVISLDALAKGNVSTIYGLTMGGALGGFVLAMVIIFTRPENPATLMSIYAVLEGLFVGALTTVMEIIYPGIAMQAVLGTLAITVTMFGLYSFRVIRPTPTFNKIMFGMLGSIMLLYIMSFVLRLFTPYDVPFLHSNGPIGIAVTAFILLIASLSLISDFGFIEAGVQMNSPKNGEWWGAFGLLITLIWIYIEVLRLLSKLRSD